MEQFEEGFRELRDTVRDGVRDHSLVAGLRKIVEGVRLDAGTARGYCEHLFKLYDYSNASVFITRPPHLKSTEPIVFDPLAIGIKTIVLKMLANLVAFFNDNPVIDLPHSLLYEALQIMVMVSRVLLDLDRSSDVRPVYTLVITFREAVGPVLAADSQLVHRLNVIELLDLDVDSRKIDILQFKNALEEIQLLSQSSPSGSGYLQLAQHLTLEVVLKLLKKGMTGDASTLLPYLPQKAQRTISELMSVNPKQLHEDNTSLKISPFYELYLQIKQSGVEDIAEQKLRMFLSEESRFNDSRLFDVVALTGEILPLEVWFMINLNTRAKGEQIQAAYRCFMFMIDVGIDRADGGGGAGSLVEDAAKKDGILTGLLKLSKVVMVTILGQKKDSIDPVINLVKRLSKLLIHLVLTLHSNIETIQEYIDKLTMICNKYSLNQVTRSISCIAFYYELVMGVANETSFGRFCKSNLVDKGSELFRGLKMAYQFRSGKEVAVSEERELLRKDPFMMLLFASDPQEQLVLRIEPREFARMGERWEIYLLLLQDESAPSMPVLCKLLTHIEETLIAGEWHELGRLDLDNIEDITACLLPKLSDQAIASSLKVNICIVLLYLVSLKTFHSKLAVLNGCVLLNRYSKLLKLLSLTSEELPHLDSSQKQKILELFRYLSKTYLCSQHQVLILINLSEEIPVEAGFLILLDALYSMIASPSKTIPMTNQEQEYFQFIRFEILCLSASVSQSEIIYEKNVKLLKLYCSSKYIKKGLKLRIMRKLVREDLIKDSRLLSLKDLGELIEIVEEVKEKRIFAGYVLRSFGEEGRKYLMLRSAQDPEGFGFLEEVGEEEGEFDF